MALVICTAGQIKLLTLMLKTALDVDESFTLHLYQNDVAPSISSNAGTFTECDFTGYNSLTLTRSGWATPTTVSTAAQSSYAGPSWTCTGGSNTIYGAYVLDGSNNLVWAERFPIAKVVSSGDVLDYTPVFAFTTG